MSPALAKGLCCLYIAALFFLDRSRKTRVSSAVWIPAIWLSIAGSRLVSQWLGGFGGGDSSTPFVEGNSFDASIFAGLLLLGLVVLFARRKSVRRLLRANGPLLLFFIYCAASFIWSDYPFVAFKRWIKAVGDLIMVLVVLTDPEPVAALKRLLFRVGAVLVPFSIVLIRYYPSIGREYSEWTGAAYNIGVATGKNGLGYVCLIFGLGTLWCFVEAFRGRHKGRRPLGPLLAYGSLLALTLWLFDLAHSATSFSCFLIAAALMAIASARAVARRPVVVSLLVGTLIFVVVYGLFLNPAAGLAETVGRDSTLTGRTKLWNTVLSLTVNPILGAGYESFWLGERLQKVWATNWEHPNQAHNGYLEVYLDLGWLGLTMLAIVIVWAYQSILRGLRSDPEAGRIRLAFLVVALLYNLTEHAFRELHPVWIAFLFAVTVVPASVARVKTRKVVSLGASLSQAAPSLEEV